MHVFLMGHDDHNGKVSLEPPGIWRELSNTLDHDFTSCPFKLILDSCSGVNRAIRDDRRGRQGCNLKTEYEFVHAKRLAKHMAGRRSTPRPLNQTDEAWLVTRLAESSSQDRSADLIC